MKHLVWRYFLCCFVCCHNLFSFELNCPHGCGSANDPEVEAVGSQILNTLKQMQFLDETISGSDGSTYEGEWYGDTWELNWHAEDSLCEIEDDEGDVVEERMQYIFWREAIQDGDSQDWFVTELNHYLETQALALMKYIWGISMFYLRSVLENNKGQMGTRMLSKIMILWVILPYNIFKKCNNALMTSIVKFLRIVPRDIDAQDLCIVLA